MSPRLGPARDLTYLGGMPDTAAQPSSASDRIGVLLVEDDALLRIDIVDKLEEVGLDVIEARDADMALTVLASRSDVRVMITDVDFIAGRMSGFDLARQVAKDRPEIGIVITSGRARPNFSDLPAGARFIPKPCTAQTLRGAVFEQIERLNDAF